MLLSCRDRAAVRRQACHIQWCSAGIHRSVSQLAVVIVAPTFHPACHGQYAGMTGSGCNRPHDSIQSSDFNGLRCVGCIGIRASRAGVTVGVRCHGTLGGSYSKAPNSRETMLSSRRWPVRKQFFSVRARAVPCHTMRLASSCLMDIFVPIDVDSGRLNSQPVGMSVGKLCRAAS